MASKVALITGCSSGIGKALATELINKGWNVIATARKPETLAPLEDIGCKTLKLDITSHKQIDAATTKVFNEEKRIDLLINNAGYGLMGPSVEISAEEEKKQFETNLFGPLELIKKVAPIMRSQKSGLIVNIGSISGIAITPFSGPYCASKAALHAYSDALRMELAPFGIKVLMVQPGAIESNFGESANKTVTSVLKTGSWYESIEKYVHKRAMSSQEDTTPANVFAKKMVSEILKQNPSPVIRIGKKSFILPFIKRILSNNMSDRIFKKKFGLLKL